MKNVHKLFVAMRSIAIIALVAAIGFSMAACGGEDEDDIIPSYNPVGGWEFTIGEDTATVYIADGKWMTSIGGETISGTYTQSGNVITLKDESGDTLGTATLANDKTVTLTLNDSTGMAGTYAGTKLPPENVPVEYRWSIWRDPSSTATLVNFSVDDDGKATITTGGKPEPQGVNNKWQAWKITAEYAYTSKANTAYKYVIEASKQGPGERRINVQYYESNADNVYLGEGFTLTETPEQYTIYGQRLPKQGEPIRFQCADYTGTFYLKIISIDEYEPGELTITNFRGTPGLRTDKWTMGEAHFFIDGEEVTVVFIQLANGFNVPTSGSSITVTVHNAVDAGDEGWEKTTPFTKTATVAAGELRIDQWGGNTPDLFYVNKVPITFTKGKATINFGTQMVKREVFDGEGGGDKPVTPEPPGGGTDSAFNGTWIEGSGTTMTIKGNSVRITSDEGELFGSGTFTTSGNEITVTFTEGEEEQIGTFTGTFSLNGNTLTMDIGGENTTWTRQP